MKKNQIPFRLLLSFILGLLCLSLPIPPANAGGIPATALQYPVLVFSQNSQAAITGISTETNLFQCTIPGNYLGNNGVIRITAVSTNDATAGHAHLYCGYLGGALGTLPVSSGGTGIFTNSLALANQTMWQKVIFLRNTNWLVSAAGDKSTNSFAAFGAAVGGISVNTSTNIPLTITAIPSATADSVALDFILVEVFGGLN